jgi:hypothetical protein
VTEWSDDLDALFEPERRLGGPTAQAKTRMRRALSASLGANPAAATASWSPAAVSLAKLTATALVAGALATGLFGGRLRTLVLSPTSSVDAPPVPRERAPAAEFSGAAPPAATAAAVPSSAVPRDPGAPARQARVSANAPPADTLAAELAEVDAIEESLRRGDPSTALALAGAYGRHYPAGALREEATGAGIIAQCRLGRSGAEDAARTYARAHPRSLLVPRIRAACGAYDSITDERSPGQ